MLTCKPLKADTGLVNLQLQSAGLEKTGKPDCQLVIEGLEGLGPVSLTNILRSLVACLLSVEKGGEGEEGAYELEVLA